MKKSHWLLLALIVALLAGVLWLNYKEKGNTLKPELTDFAVTDTASIDRIYLADKDKHEVLLEREKKSGTWIVNKKFTARPDAVKTLLSTICDVTVKAPVGRASFNTVVKRMAAKSTKCEIYRNGKLHKTYYVGGATQDFMGTYMMIEGSGAPFITWIPGFEGYLYTRYFSYPDQWRKPSVFELKPQDIYEIRYQVKDKPEEGWVLTNRNNQVTLKDGNLQTIQGIDSSIVREYLTRFSRINYEAIVRDFQQKDSLLALSPRETMAITNLQGKTVTLETWPKRTPADLIFDEEHPMEYDPDRFFGVVNHKKDELLLLQYHVFDPILKPASFFSRGKQIPVKK